MKNVNNFTVDEYDATFRTVGETPYWFTLSGGEPFLRHDIVDIVRVIYKRCKPGIINIPTNASFHDRIPSEVEEMCKSCPSTKIVINVSLDAVGERHDLIRGFPGNFDKAMKTMRGLKEIQRDNLTIGIHSVISRFSLGEIEEIMDFVAETSPDSYITEVAEEREELDTMGSVITPSPEEYASAVDYVAWRTKKLDTMKVGRFTKAFRLSYYEIAKQILGEKTQVIPCHAGWASCQLSPDGDIWPCAIRGGGSTFGNLRKENYDFPKIWFNPKSREIRSSIRNKECYCTLANAHYTNMLLHPPTLMAVGGRLLRREPAPEGLRVETFRPPPRPSLADMLESESRQLVSSRTAEMKSTKHRAGEPAEIDANYRCLCGRRIIVQRGQTLPTCNQCGRTDWWYLETPLMN